jgi:HD-GYP domain-containing protein (c-di-GMP phosphodiesterase class II)
MPVTIDVDQLHEGMFVHLDLGWWQHPFALSSFMISSSEQIETIRSLGLRRLRWSPDLSRVERAHADAGAAAGQRPAAAANDAADPAPRQRAALAAQRAADQHCEKQYAEAMQAWKRAVDKVRAEPVQAGEIATALARSIVDKMLAHGELCIRVLSDVHGDRGGAHALNVGVVSLLLGRQQGLAAGELLELGTGALLHDVGKLELTDRVRHVDTGFTQAEHALYRDHVPLGVALGRRMGLARGAMQVLGQHHEMADGSGFPYRLKGDDIATAARIVALVNRYDNLCNAPTASQALTPHEALAMIFAQARSKFDGALLGAFIRMMGVYPPGSLVQLTDDRYATVISVNSSRPLKPRVLACDPKVGPDDAPLLDLDAHPDLGIRRSVKAAQLPAQAFAYLSPRKRIVYFFEPSPTPHRDPLEDLAA